MTITLSLDDYIIDGNVTDDDDDDNDTTRDYSSNLQLQWNLGYHIFLNLKLPSGLDIYVRPSIYQQGVIFHHCYFILISLLYLSV